MPGAVGSNFHAGSRSEMLADYFFGTFGPVTPVRGHDDFGIDLYCALVERKGQRSVPVEYYSVQVKSVADPWVFNDPESIRWLMEHNNPIFLCVVDKYQATVEVFHTFGRFAILPDRPPEQIILRPGSGESGRCCQWDASGEFDLSAPIIRAGVAEFYNPDRNSIFREVLKRWLAHERTSLDNRRAGLVRWEMPAEYATNSAQIASSAGSGWYPHRAQDIALGIRRLAEAVDCVGDQLRFIKDIKTATRAALLLHRLRTTYPQMLPPNGPAGFHVAGSLLSDVSRGLGLSADADRHHVLEQAQLDFDQLERVARYYEHVRGFLPIQDPFRYRHEADMIE